MVFKSANLIFVLMFFIAELDHVSLCFTNIFSGSLFQLQCILGSLQILVNTGELNDEFSISKLLLVSIFVIFIIADLGAVL